MLYWILFFANWIMTGSQWCSKLLSVMCAWRQINEKLQNFPVKMGVIWAYCWSCVMNGWNTKDAFTNNDCQKKFLKLHKLFNYSTNFPCKISKTQWNYNRTTEIFWLKLFLSQKPTRIIVNTKLLLARKTNKKKNSPTFYRKIMLWKLFIW